MSTQPALSEPIATYFRAKNSDRLDETLACFSPNAVIVDVGENMEVTGHEAILKWLTGTVAAYNLTTEVTKSVKKNGETIVSALVSGDFPGSPIEFEYHFVVHNDRIERLVIQ